MDRVEDVVRIAYCGIARTGKYRAGKQGKRQQGNGRFAMHLDRLRVSALRCSQAVKRNKAIAECVREETEAETER